MLLISHHTGCWKAPQNYAYFFVRASFSFSAPPVKPILAPTARRTEYNGKNGRCRLPASQSFFLKLRNKFFNIKNCIIFAAETYYPIYTFPYGITQAQNPRPYPSRRSAVAVRHSSEPGRNRQTAALLRKRRLLHHGSLGRRCARLGDALSRRIAMESSAHHLQGNERKIPAERSFPRPQPLRLCALPRQRSRRFL